MRLRSIAIGAVTSLAMSLLANAAGAQFDVGKPATTPARPSTPVPDAPSPAPSEAGARIAGPSGNVVAGPVDPDEYVIGAGDVFQLVMAGRMTREMLLTVGPEGLIVVPGSGAVRLGGLTLTQGRRELQRSMGGEFRGVHLDLHLIQVRIMRVYVVGDVKAPGPVEIPATSRVSDALGFKVPQDGASTRNIRVRRLDSPDLIADLSLFNRTGRYDRNPYLREGDIVWVPPAVDFLEIEGALAHPGRYELGPADSLLTLFDLAGGPLAATLVDKALLVRWKNVTEPDSTFFNVEDVYRRVFNPVLHEGDRVYVYFTPSYHELFQATILGELERPGTYPLALGKTRLADLVRSAGGFRPRADLSTIRVYRASNLSQENDIELERLSRLSRSEMTDTEYEVLRTRLSARREDFRVDWVRLQQSPELNILIAPGDVVRVDPILATVRVEGEVRRPGLVDFDPKYRIQDYVRVAGGFSNRAAPGKVLITRSVTGQTLRAQDVPALAPGDMIWVPERPDKTIWENLQTIIMVAAQVATVAIAVRR